MKNTENWEICTPGTLERYRGQFPSETRQRSMSPYVKAFVAGAVLAVTIFGVSLLRDNDSVPSMACADVISQLQDYHVQKTDAKTTEAIAAHLATCPTCAARYQEIATQTANHNWQHRAIAASMPSGLSAIIAFAFL